jgi:pantothenate kinase type III
MKINHIIAAGGLADLMVNEIREIEVILPDLILEGIRIIWGKNKRRC